VFRSETEQFEHVGVNVDGSLKSVLVPGSVRVHVVKDLYLFLVFPSDR